MHWQLIQDGRVMLWLSCSHQVNHLVQQRCDHSASWRFFQLRRTVSCRIFTSPLWIIYPPVLSDCANYASVKERAAVCVELSLCACKCLKELEVKGERWVYVFAPVAPSTEKSLFFVPVCVCECVRAHAWLCVCLWICLFCLWCVNMLNKHKYLLPCLHTLSLCMRVCVCVLLAELLLWHCDSLCPLRLLRRQLVQRSSHQHDKHHPDQTHAYLLSRGQDSRADQEKKKAVHSLHTRRKKLWRHCVLL